MSRFTLIRFWCAVIAALGALAAGCGSSRPLRPQPTAQPDPPYRSFKFSDWDGNADYEIDGDEFHAGMTKQGDFARIDVNKDQRIDARELAEALPDAWDLNDDGVVQRDEFRSAAQAWYQVEYGGFDAWDQDNDNVLDQDDFYTGVHSTGLYSEWDQDRSGFLDAMEVERGLFERLDADRSGGLAEPELRDGPYYP